MRVLILGATGNVSRAIADTLSAEYPEIALRLASSRAEGCAALARRYPGAEIVQADYYRADTLRSALAGAHKVSVVAADATDERRATPNLVDAVDAADGVLQIMRLLAYPPGRCYEDLPSELKASGMGPAQHLTAKAILQESGLPVTFVNATAWYMSNLPWLTGAGIREHHQLALPYPREVTWLDPREIGEAMARLLAADAASQIGREYLLTGAERLSFQDAARALSEVLGFEVAYTEDPAPFRRTFGDMADAFLEFFRVDQHAYDDTEITDTMERLLGRPPKPLHVWIREHARQFK